MEVLSKNLTFKEFRELEFDDNDPFWYDLINGQIVQKQSPSMLHQRISGKIEFELTLYAKKTQSGEMFHAPLDVVLDDNNAYHPDIFFIKNERSFILNTKEQAVIGAPDLVVEILSKSTAVYDKGTKKDNYERNGVREYWLIDPRNKSVEIYTLAQQRYQLTTYQEETGIVSSIALQGFSLELNQIFEDAI